MNNQAQVIIETNNLSSQKTNHILHLILSIISMGVWLPIWILVGANNAIERGRTESRITKLVDGE